MLHDRPIAYRIAFAAAATARAALLPPPPTRVAVLAVAAV